MLACPVRTCSRRERNSSSVMTSSVGKNPLSAVAIRPPGRYHFVYCGIGISAVPSLPKAVRRVRLPYPAIEAHPPPRVGFCVHGEDGMTPALAERFAQYAAKLRFSDLP